MKLVVIEQNDIHYSMNDESLDPFLDQPDITHARLGSGFLYVVEDY